MNTRIHCSACGFDLSGLETSDKPEPCPECGEIKRHVYASIKPAEIKLTAPSVNARATFGRESSSLLLKGLLIPESKTEEGTLIRAVAPAWFEIIRQLRENPAAAFEIPPRKWEEIVAGAYDAAGFDEVILTPASGDLGRDVIAVKRGIGQVRVIDQVKAYQPGHLVTANDVRALMGVLEPDGASKGFVTTTSDFAPMIASDPSIQHFIPGRLELVNGEQLFSRLSDLVPNSSK
ncbi:MAG: restriction endonuclease [Planctomycetaceae bacterium]|nr:restriction endonuclease [Planctomycetaceae bacterium]